MTQGNNDLSPYKLARMRCGLSQRDAAVATGVKAGTLSRIETGKAEPTIATLRRMAAAYQTTADYLIGLDDPPLMPGS
jgi:transcriptional regulator with XRE-family HTH domain